MKKVVLILSGLLLMLTGCKQIGKIAAGEETDSLATRDVQTTTAEDVESSDEESLEVADEEMEDQSGMYDFRDIEKSWKNRTIQVTGDKSDIVALFGAFYNEWPTHEGNRIMHQAQPNQVPEGEYYEEGSIIDLKNGYVESAWYEGEDLNEVSACVWKRKNGHKLFAVTTNSFLCFYDFDPAKKTLTPEESPIKKEHLSFPAKKPLWYDLPQEGKTLVVVEDAGAGGDGIAFTYYTFDGQNLKFAGHEN